MSRLDLLGEDVALLKRVLSLVDVDHPNAPADVGDAVRRAFEVVARADTHGPHYNARPCHKFDPRTCILAEGHEGECDDDEASMQFISGGDGGRYA